MARIDDDGDLNPLRETDINMSSTDLSMDSANLLQNIFNDIPLETITSILESVNYNIGDAVDIITAGQRRNEGTGYCARGDACAFAHGDKVAQIVADMKEKEIPPGPSGTQRVDEFPALSARMNAASLIDFRSPPGKFTDAVKKKVEMQKQTGIPVGGKRQEKTSKVSVADDVQWVKTGTDISALYVDSRKEAEEAARERNRLLQRATEAYIRGDKAAAKALSVQAHRLNETMAELHEEAARNIFQKRNENADVASNKKVYDLHGLHDTEAIKMIEAEISKLRHSRFRGTLCLITGTGHHSRSPSGSKLYSAVQRYLRSCAFRFTEGKMADGRGGMFLLDFQ
ncbi:hypothetical protein HDU76_013209 [Blyttiomyces sp. JEL0837]|nr:hypothetical protein HDU76_013209 [Blyttiomyces sp. JEL0837]